MDSEDKNKQQLKLLKERADVMGIKYSPNIGVEALKEKIIEKRDADSTKKAEIIKTTKSVEKKEETETEIRNRLIKEANKLVRVRLANLDPDKNNLSGEIITFSNKYTGKISKMIPFGEATTNGYHIPQVILDVLKNKKFVMRSSKKVGNETVLVSKLVPEYSVEVLPDLTTEELEELAQQQQAAERLGG